VPFRIEIDREDDGRWIAEVSDLAGVLVYGASQQEAVDKAKMLALRVVADCIEHGELAPEPASSIFTIHRVAG
jgi:predicted RNase H-like HicB family nuclease